VRRAANETRADEALFMARLRDAGLLSGDAHRSYLEDKPAPAADLAAVALRLRLRHGALQSRSPSQFLAWLGRERLATRAALDRAQLLRVRAPASTVCWTLKWFPGNLYCVRNFGGLHVSWALGITETNRMCLVLFEHAE
jgi:hypothetical protein